MKNNTVIDLDNPEGIDPLTELLSTGAKKLIAEAIQAAAGNASSSPSETIT